MPPTAAVAATISPEPVFDNECESFRQTAYATRSHRTDRRGVARISSRSVAPETGDYRNGGNGESRVSSNHSGKASWARRSLEHRRLRDWLFVVELSQPVPGRYVED